MIRTGWRIVMEEQSATAFNGEGARLFGGRWNSAGVSVVYAAEHLSLAALETRVHIDQIRMKKRYVGFGIAFNDSLVKTLHVSDLPKDWRQEPPHPSLQVIGDRWVKSGDSVILAVPSVIIPQELNLLINPLHPDFKKIVIGKPNAFIFDPRLF